jgi:hypothetical protein
MSKTLPHTHTHTHTHTHKQVKYLDPRPIFPLERVCACAWVAEGKEGEERVREEWKRKEDNEHKESLRVYREWASRVKKEAHTHTHTHRDGVMEEKKGENEGEGHAHTYTDTHAEREKEEEKKEDASQITHTHNGEAKKTKGVCVSGNKTAQHTAAEEECVDVCVIDDPEGVKKMGEAFWSKAEKGKGGLGVCVCVGVCECEGGGDGGEGKEEGEENGGGGACVSVCVEEEEEEEVPPLFDVTLGCLEEVD